MTRIFVVLVLLGSLSSLSAQISTHFRLGAGSPGGISIDTYEGHSFAEVPGHFQGEVAYHPRGHSSVGLFYRYQQNRRGDQFKDQALGRNVHVGLRYASDLAQTGEYTSLEGAMSLGYGREKVRWAEAGSELTFHNPTGEDLLQQLHVGIETCIKAQFEELVLKIGGGVRYDVLIDGNRTLFDPTFMGSRLFSSTSIGQGRFSADLFISLGFHFAKK